MKLVVLSLLATALLTAEPVGLEGEWRWNGGGDHPDFAKPGFDDSAWRPLTLPLRARLPMGIFWLRKTVLVRERDLPREPWLVVGAIDACHEAFVNGVRVGETGCDIRDRLAVLRPRHYNIPTGLLRAGEPVVIALRLRRGFMGSTAVIPLRDEGPYLLADADYALAEAERARLLSVQAMGLFALAAYSQLGIAVLLVVLWLANRERRELLWFALFLAGVFAFNCSAVAALVGNREWGRLNALSLLIGFVSLHFCAHRVLRGEAFAATKAVLIVLLVVASGFLTPFAVVPALWLPAIWSLQRIRNGSPEQRLFASAILLYVAAIANATAARSVPGWPLEAGTYIGPFAVPYSATISAVSAVGILVALLRIVAADGREKYRLATEFEAARSVQQLLIHAYKADLPLAVDAMYLPAGEVGGDFYHCLEDGAGGLTVVIGDVSGKGLKAAMVVAMVLGVLRRDRSLAPSALLESISESVDGILDGGFVTCLCAHFAPDGRVRLANAGHLAPFCSGSEVPVESGLPLGVIAKIHYPETAFELGEGEQITFLSDGVVEASNVGGELFGFERTRLLSMTGAKKIAEAAREWGQNDDITVVTVRRHG